MKGNLKYLFPFLILTLVLTGCRPKRSAIPPLRETFSKKDTNPFGAYVFYHELEQMFNYNSIRDKKANFENTWQSISDTGSLYVCICKNLFLGDTDREAMLAYVSNGNSMFISCENIDTGLLNKLNCATSRSFSFYQGFMPLMKYTSVKLAATLYKDSAAYNYFYFPFYNFFSAYDKNAAKALGKNEAGLVNYIVVFYGRGRFYMHCEPRSLSNYFLLQKNNYRYLQDIFSFMPATPEHVFWDDHYSKKNYAAAKNGKTGLAVLLQYPPMAWAFWLAMLLLALFVLSGSKRRQRIVPVLPSNKNTTVAFTETVGRLYLEKKDNRNIADKMITYFLEHIRNQYYLTTNHINDEFITILSRKSNVNREITESLFTLILQVQGSPQVSDQQLISLNQKIEKFHKNKV